MSIRSGGSRLGLIGILVAFFALVEPNCSVATEAIARIPVLPKIGAASPSAPIHAPNTVGTFWTVNSTADTTDGVCDGTSCTLREAMIVAQPGDTIVFSSVFAKPQTIRIGSALPDINADLSITGPGANLLTVRANDGGNYTILLINSGAVTISGLTISNGNGDFGGGISNFGTLSLVDSVISGNHASQNGGGIQNGGSMTISGSTISGNTSGAAGGGLFNFTVGGYTATVSLVNTTISGNSSSSYGAISNVNFDGAAPTVTLTNCTIVGNSGGGAGLASVNAASGATINLKNTIVANNTVPSLSASGAGAQIVSLGNNLATDNGNGFLVGSGDLINTDPLLGALERNGGKTPTHLLALGSPALNAGNNSGAPVTDQRGVSRPTGGIVDIGAVELNPLLVTVASDPGDGDCDATCTLRDAITTANADGAAADDIFFTQLFNTPQIINLTAVLPSLSTDMTINAPGANLLTLRRDTGGDYLILGNHPGTTVHLSGLTIANGSSDFDGGIENQGDMTISASALVGNHANVTGGAIGNIGSGTLIIDSTTVSGNTAGYGAGLLAQDGATVLRNCTFSGNTATTVAGGIVVIGTANSKPSVSLINCTIAHDVGPGGGGLYLADQGGPATAELQNTILANNGINFSGAGANITIVSKGNNLVDDAGGGVLNGPGDQINANPRLATFSNYGGTTLTYYPKSGSPAIDAGNDAASPATDQRGVARPQGTHVDIGAIEADGVLIFQNGFDGS